LIDSYVRFLFDGSKLQRTAKSKNL